MLCKTIGQLNEYDANVLEHGDQQLAISLGLAFLAAFAGDLIDFGNPVNQFGDLFAELFGDLRIQWPAYPR